ncbi:hypothetical protein KR026_002539 [Drosophila bipectinata]|nr:hypothetical protein KR026_002539 [Drosophila bipectinata]
MDIKIFIFYMILWIAELLAQPIIPEDDIEPYQCPPDHNDWPTYNDGFSCIPCQEPHCPIFVMGEGVDTNGCPVFECLEEAPVCKDNTTSAKYYLDRCTLCDACSELQHCVEYCLVEPRDCWSNISKELKTEGDSWTEEHGCRECTCREGNISCTQYWCKPLDCKPEDYIHHDNECCPTCPEKEADISSEAPREVSTESSSSSPILDFTEGFSESTEFTDSTPNPVKSYTDDSTTTMASSSEYFSETSTDSTTFFDLQSSTDSTTFSNLDSSTRDQISEEPDIFSASTEQTTDKDELSTETVESTVRTPVVTDTPYIPELPPVINQTKEGGDSEPTRRATKNDAIEESQTQDNFNFFYMILIFIPLVCIVVWIVLIVIKGIKDKSDKVEYKPTSTQPQEDGPEEVYPFLTILKGETIHKETTRV